MRPPNTNPSFRLRPADDPRAKAVQTRDYTAEPVRSEDGSLDVRILHQGRIRHLGGRRGPENELQRVAQITDRALPVLLGSGLGKGLEHVLQSWPCPVAVVDRESAITELTGARRKWAHNPRVFWIADPDPESVLDQLTRWQLHNGGMPFAPVLDPFYARLDPPYYRALAERLAVSRKADFWGAARYPKFSHLVPRILLLTSSYFLMGEIEAACKRLGFATAFVQLPSQEIGSQEFVERILAEVVDFRPDFVMTINHLGVDKEGVLTNLLAQMQLPLASWFVDNPHLILYLYGNLASEWVTLFTWDADNIESLKTQGFTRVHYLPLATDPHRFRLRKAVPVREVAFVGNSMVHKVRAKLQHHVFPAGLIDDLDLLGQAFKESGILSVAAFLDAEFPDHATLFGTMPDTESRLAYETLLTWKSTLDHRLEHVIELLPFHPNIVGDKGWFDILPSFGWSHHPELNYYSDLPFFYPATRINFNCTSQQMKGAVNQRVFDVPVCGGFLLTDHRRQMEDLFEPGREMICYADRSEIAGLVRHYLARDAARQKIVTAGRVRILAHHTYDQRLTSLVRTMRETYGRP
ncbi:MAG: glycosyltransferase [Desulfovibrionales bacterium]|nr:glycosyltransferase [Desulfovibrionales bacterium]